MLLSADTRKRLNMRSPFLASVVLILGENGSMPVDILHEAVGKVQEDRVGEVLKGKSACCTGADTIVQIPSTHCSKSVVAEYAS